MRSEKEIREKIEELEKELYEGILLNFEKVVWLVIKIRTLKWVLGEEQ